MLNRIMFVAIDILVKFLKDTWMSKDHLIVSTIFAEMPALRLTLSINRKPRLPSSSSMPVMTTTSRHPTRRVCSSYSATAGRRPARRLRRA
jgi:hypothetical protein